jgi:hypothetical protein
MTDGHCMSIKSRTEPNLQCPNSKKFGDLCGVHHRTKNVVRIDPNKIGTVASTTDQIILNINVRKPSRTTEEIKVIEPEFYDDIEYLNKSTIDDLKYDKLLKTLKHLQIQIKGSKAQLLKSLVQYIKGRSAITKAYETPETCNNQMDFYDFVELKEIPKEYLFIFMCLDGHLYGLDIRSLYTYFTELEKEASLMEKPVDYINPYNRYKLSSNTICDYRTRVEELKKNNMALKYVDVDATPKEKVEFRVVNIFQTIASYGYTVDPNIFLGMEKLALIAFYGVMEDMWNHRFNLSIAIKRNIVPNDVNIFSQSEFHHIKHMDKAALQNIMLNKIDTFINSGTDKEYRIQAIHYILIALNDVCGHAYVPFESSDGDLEE